MMTVSTKERDELVRSVEGELCELDFATYGMFKAIISDENSVIEFAPRNISARITGCTSCKSDLYISVTIPRSHPMAPMINTLAATWALRQATPDVKQLVADALEQE